MSFNRRLALVRSRIKARRQRAASKKPDFVTEEHLNYLDENYGGEGTDHSWDSQMIVNLESLYSLTEGQVYELLEYWVELRYGHPANF